MNTTQNDTQVITLTVQMQQINKQFEKLEIFLSKKFDELDKKFLSLDKKFATKEELHNVKGTMRLYKNGILFVGGAITLYLITYTFNNIFRL